jgi:hypothetical protein
MLSDNSGALPYFLLESSTRSVSASIIISSGAQVITPLLDDYNTRV